MIEAKLATLIGEVLSVLPENVDESTSMQFCAAWTSLQHFNLILTLESAYGIRFSSERIPDLITVGAIQQELKTLRRLE